MTHESVDKRVRLLVVEDVETTRNMYVRNLELDGDYRVDTAADLEQATAALDLVSYHVALVDIMLAGPKDTSNRDGAKVLERIRDMGEGTRAIVLSGQSETQQVREFLKELDAFDYLDKDALLEAGIGKMVEYVDTASAGSPLGSTPSWEIVSRALGGAREEPEFVSEMLALRFGGGFENLRQTLAASIRHLLPLLPPREGEAGLTVNGAGAMSASFWSKGQGCAVEIAVVGKNSTEAPPSGEETLLAREKGGLGVSVTRLDEPRQAFADSVV